jgi:hypothetical protein
LLKPAISIEEDKIWICEIAVQWLSN